jgi:hypothetical protein
MRVRRTALGRIRVEVVRVVRERRDRQTVAIEDLVNRLGIESGNIDVRCAGVAAALASGGGPARDLERLEALTRSPRGDTREGTTREGSGE